MSFASRQTSYLVRVASAGGGFVLDAVPDPLRTWCASLVRAVRRERVWFSQVWLPDPPKIWFAFGRRLASVYLLRVDETHRFRSVSGIVVCPIPSVRVGLLIR